MRQSFEMLEIFWFWLVISNITRTGLEYMVTRIRLEFFPAKKISPAGDSCITYFSMRKTFLRLGCGKQMKTKGKRPEGIVFTNADPRLDDPQGGDATMLM